MYKGQTTIQITGAKAVIGYIRDMIAKEIPGTVESNRLNPFFKECNQCNPDCCQVLVNINADDIFKALAEEKDGNKKERIEGVIAISYPNRFEAYVKTLRKSQSVR